ncbi:RagB/SusD family nutrient uptake outer membrane protein [Sphingobacterium multivorum]|uniref:RagB/SusD family nutrient uptake outer membrane protein n=1 Tax=Sphingobacterium multivorum TaxID=28454 RepID=UPI002FDA179B
MKFTKLKYIVALAVLGTASLTSCKKFLNVTPIDALSGNNFWQTRTDVKNYMNGIYLKLRYKFGNSILIPSLDMRGNFIKVVQDIGSNGNTTVGNLVSNNLNGISSASSYYDNLVKNNMDWKGWYDVIAASNILYFEVGNMPESAISAAEKKTYQAQAVFTRNLCYLYLSKMFGDVIYYTDAYHSAASKRVDKVEVMKSCIADMLAAKDNLPVKYADASQAGINPSRGAAIALLMHLNMWAAAWDEGDKTVYYQAVATLNEELASYTDYYLLPITTENTKRIFKGRSVENLFTVLQDYNYGETFNDYANYSFFFSHYPYRGTSSKTQSFVTYEKEYINKLFPAAVNDSRRALWFENIDAENNTFQFKKFINTYSTGAGSNVTMYSDDSAIIFRLPDAILLAAEAYAELGKKEKAQENLNKVRQAAGAVNITSDGESLKDDIYRERCRELIGEGHFYFDLVRTKRVMNSDFSKTVMSVGNFNNGAWTWPLTISAEEKSANPNLVGNTYWN